MKHFWPSPPQKQKLNSRSTTDGQDLIGQNLQTRNRPSTLLVDQ